jgi:VanZ family protein
LAQSQWRPTPALVWLLLWGLFIIYATTLPFDFSASDELIRKRLSEIWEHPLRGARSAVRDVVSNVLLFMPWGFLLGIWLAGRGRHFVVALTAALLSGAIMSGTVEFIQLFSPARQASPVDVVTNTFGSTVGAAIGWPFARSIWPQVSIQIRQLLATRPVMVCALATAAGLVIAGLTPFELSLQPSDLKAALGAARPIPFRAPVEGSAAAARFCLWGAELLVWVMAGGLFALAAREAGRRGNAVIAWATVPAAALSCVIEVLHLMIPERNVDLTSVALAVAGSTIGSVSVARSADTDARRWVKPALLLWGAAVVLAAWNPPRFAWPNPPFWKPDMVVPFWSYFDSRSLADLADLVKQVLVFVPLGALLAARSWRQSFTGAVLIGLALGALLELGQAFVPGRSSDITDAISAASGSGLGLMLWRWGEWTRTSSMGVARYRVRPRSGLKL